MRLGALAWPAAPAMALSFMRMVLTLSAVASCASFFGQQVVAGVAVGNLDHLAALALAADVLR